MAGEILFPGVSMRLFLEGISILIGRLSQQDHHHQGRWGTYLLELVHPSSPALGHWCSWFLGLWTQIRTYIITHPESQAFGVRLSYTTGFPASPVGKGQITRPLDLHNYVN